MTQLNRDGMISLANIISRFQSPLFCSYCVESGSSFYSKLNFLRRPCHSKAVLWRKCRRRPTAPAAHALYLLFALPIAAGDRRAESSSEAHVFVQPGCRLRGCVLEIWTSRARKDPFRVALRQPSPFPCLVHALVWHSHYLSFFPPIKTDTL